MARVFAIDSRAGPEVSGVFLPKQEGSSQTQASPTDMRITSSSTGSPSARVALKQGLNLISTRGLSEVVPPH